jgi:hypothetical protein
VGGGVAQAGGVGGGVSQAAVGSAVRAAPGTTPSQAAAQAAVGSANPSQSAVGSARGGGVVQGVSQAVAQAATPPQAVAQAAVGSARGGGVAQGVSQAVAQAAVGSARGATPSQAAVGSTTPSSPLVPTINYTPSVATAAKPVNVLRYGRNQDLIVFPVSDWQSPADFVSTIREHLERANATYGTRSKLFTDFFKVFHELRNWKTSPKWKAVLGRDSAKMITNPSERNTIRIGKETVDFRASTFNSVDQIVEAVFARIDANNVQMITDLLEGLDTAMRTSYDVLIKLHKASQAPQKRIVRSVSPPQRKRRQVLQEHDVLFVYSEIIEPLRFNSDKVRCLRCLSHRRGDLSYSFQNVLYHKVERNFIPQITIALLDQYGQPYQFQTSDIETVLTLHFRKLAQ